MRSWVAAAFFLPGLLVGVGGAYLATPGWLVPDEPAPPREAPPRPLIIFRALPPGDTAPGLVALASEAAVEAHVIGLQLDLTRLDLGSQPGETIQHLLRSTPTTFATARLDSSGALTVAIEANQTRSVAVVIGNGTYVVAHQWPSADPYLWGSRAGAWTPLPLPFSLPVKPLIGGGP